MLKFHIHMFHMLKLQLLFGFPLTSSKASQASLLGAKKVYDPAPSISGLSLEISEYLWVEVAFTRPKVPYTWSMGATSGEIHTKHY